MAPPNDEALRVFYRRYGKIIETEETYCNTCGMAYWKAFIVGGGAEGAPAEGSGATHPTTTDGGGNATPAR